MSRTVIWFSCGVTSAVAAKLALIEYPDAIVARIRITSEHPDSDRFSDDIQDWLGSKITILEASPYNNHFSVWDSLNTGDINGPSGAKCTKSLKRDVRKSFQLPDDLHVFGFDASEKERVEDFRERNQDLKFIAPLIDARLTKSDCKNIVERAGIRLHKMYELGYQNANCVGCVKGGMGYWNKIRIDFPEVFERMAKLERKVNATVLKKGGQRVYLDTLDPTAGRFKEDQPGDCGVICQSAMQSVGLELIKTDIK